jgi:pantoate--beta-alanine ligase
MSSRNQYLDATERQTAVEIHRTMQEMRAMAARRVPLREIEDSARARLEASGFSVDYAEVRRSDLSKAKDPDEPGLLAILAARLGRTRLIDNLPFDEE